MKPTAVFDFDGVIHSYTSGWKGATVIPDPPVDGIKEAIAEIRSAGYEVAVVSTRCASLDGLFEVEDYYNTFNKHEDMVDTLRVVKTAAGDTICANRLRGVISNWAGIVTQMPYMTPERKEAETCKLLNDILKVASEI